MIVDSHCHIQESEFDIDRELVFKRAAEAGVSAIVAPATDAETANRALSLARDGWPVFPSVGIHPTSLPQVDAAAAVVGDGLDAGRRRTE